MSESRHYPAELADALATFGLAPTPATDPLLVRDALNDLYRYELRRTRDRLLAKLLTKPEYLEEVVRLRKKYWPLSLQPTHWLDIVDGRS